MNRKIKIAFTVLLLLGGVLQAYASEMYVSKESTMVLKNGKSIKVFLGTPVEIKKKSGKEVEVTVTGFLFENKLYSSREKKLLMAVMDKSTKSKGKSTKAVALAGSMAQAHLTADFAEIWEEQKEFFFEMCTQCHAAPNVKHHSMTEWEALLGTMKGFAKIDEEETASLLRYLQSNASDGLLKAMTKH